MSWMSRYLQGDCEAVWQEMFSLGTQIREESFLPEAILVAEETMRRVARNLETLVTLLPQHGYRFNAPLLSRSVYEPANQTRPELLDRFESRFGCIPISLRAFYLHVGSVDLSQDFDQLVPWYDRQSGADFTELETLAEYQPINIYSFEELERRMNKTESGLEAPLMPDEAQNAFYSGSDYYVELLTRSVDVELPTFRGGSEPFVSFLRQSFKYAGLHGRPSESNEEDCLDFPTLPWIREIAESLLPI